MEQPKRINKFLSEAGFCSRRQADRLVDAKRVTINDEIALMGSKISERDVIKVDGEVIKPKVKDFIYIALNKPVGVVCTTDTKVEKNNIIDYINYPERIFPIGRLDKASEGLILLTNDGDIVNKILRASNNHEKEYIVTVDKPISQTFIKRMQQGIYLEDLKQRTKKCKATKLTDNTFRIILTQGLNRQIRRMCSYLNYEVQSLKRIRIMNINLDTKIGEYRNLTSQELKILNSHLESSSKTYQ